jgi:hypothetical protein
MSLENENISNNGWSEYGRLVLKELERLNDSHLEVNKSIQKLTGKILLVEQEIEAHRDLDDKVFKEVSRNIIEISTRLASHTDKVNDVWSPKQMQQAKNEIYRQKGQTQKMYGVIIAIQVIVGLLIAFKDNIFS